MAQHWPGKALLPGISEICNLRNTDLGNEIGEPLLSLGYTEAFLTGSIPLEPSPNNG